METTNKKALMARRVLACLGIGVGLVSLIFGIVIVCWHVSSGSLVNTTIKFGADYYTESYAAMATAANNIYSVSRRLFVVTRAVGYILIVAGLALMIGYALKFVATLSAKKSSEEPTYEQITDNE